MGSWAFGAVGVKAAVGEETAAEGVRQGSHSAVSWPGPRHGNPPRTAAVCERLRVRVPPQEEHTVQLLQAPQKQSRVRLTSSRPGEPPTWKDGRQFAPSSGLSWPLESRSTTE